MEKIKVIAQKTEDFLFNAKQFLRRREISSFQIITLGFLGVILLGALLLMLPFATKDMQGASFADALFTSTSAVCVTGLIVHDTATYWTFFGQLVILLLIQIGGMGVVTVALSIAVASGKKIGLMQRSLMQDSISAPKVGGIVKMTGFILRGVLIVELIGAVLLSFVFCPEFGDWQGVWYSIFHSVSAFCNAGFDLMGVKEPFSSLMSYAANPIVNLTIMTLIVVGGIGFFTWDDIKVNKWRFQQYRMQSKVILITTAVLLILPAIYFFVFEFASYPLEERIWLSLFQAVTPRTAGFNTADMSRFSDTGLLVVITLMIIGGSPGSTAGGIKTTTAAVLFASAIAIFRRKDNAHIFKRRIADSTVKSAAAILLMYVTLFLVGSAVISMMEALPMMTAMYETASAIGTVGLSLGVTPTLGTVSRLILVVLMYFGRVGGLTLIFAAVSGRNANLSRYPQENITVG